MRDGALLAGTTGLSLLLHGGLAAVVIANFAPRPPEPTPAQHAALSLATMSVKESTAREQTLAAQNMATAALDSQSLAARRIPQSASAAAPPNAEQVQSLRLPSTSPRPFEATSSLAALDRQDNAPLNPQRPTVTPLSKGATPPATKAPQAAQNPQPVTQSPQPATQISGSVPTAALSIPLSQPAPDRAAIAVAAVVQLPHQDTPAAKAPPADPRTTPLKTTILTPSALPDAPTTPTVARPATPDTAPTPAEPLPSTPATTVLAWSGTLSLDVPESTIDTATALSVPSANATGLRDALSARLGDIDCARVQTVYNPETGAIDLRGHVKGDTDRARLMDQVSSELGGALPLNDRLRNLDAPQCTVLIRLAEMPLPQSVDQLINPLIIGDDLQTRTYSYSDGQTMTFDLAGADYDGWLYLDYYDSEGQVLHLLPNEFIDPVLLPAEAPLIFGDGSANDPAQGKFSMRVSAPFGEDIAVAMVAKEPLFDAPRPTVEPAGPYLEVLAARVEQLRKTPGFKGEWVYLFIETRP